MKNIIISYLTFLISITSTLASTSFEIDIKRFQDSDNYSLFINNPALSNVIVTIADNDNKTVFQEMIPSIEKFHKIYNLSSLPKGAYSMAVDNGVEKLSRSFSLQQAKGHHPDVGKTLIAAFSKVKDKKIMIVAQNKGERIIKLSLYDKFDKKITDIITTKQPLMKQSVNLAKLTSGSYKLRISDGHSTYTTEVVLN